MEFVKPSQDKDKVDDNEREIIGLFINPSSRRYLAICDKDHRNGHIWVNIYEHRAKQLKKQIDITAEVYGSASKYKAEQKETKASGAAGEDLEEQKEQAAKVLVSLGFSKDGKTIAVIMSNQYLETKALVYDWFQRDKAVAKYDFPNQSITKISINPQDNQIICTSGPKHWKVWRI